MRDAPVDGRSKCRDRTLHDAFEAMPFHCFVVPCHPKTSYKDYGTTENKIRTCAMSHKQRYDTLKAILGDQP